MSPSTTTRRHLTDQRRLHVRPVMQAHAAIENLELQDRLRSILRNQGYGRLNDIDVLVDQDAVTLSGAVRTYYQLQLAQSLVMPLAGDRKLENEIAIL